MLSKSLIVTALVAAPVSGVCNRDWCTSPDLSSGYDCTAGNNGEKCTCSVGSARLDGDGGGGYYQYTCCDDDDKPNMGDNCGNLSCDQKYCTSPDELGTDCWASQFEGCTCSEGRVAALTGATEQDDKGETFYQYTCCPADNAGVVGDKCGFCEDGDEIVKEESQGVLEGCASGSAYGNPCEVSDMLCSSHRVV